MSTEIQKILPNHFFKNEQEKIKLNWFAFEIASEIRVTIPKSMIKTLTKNGYNENTINLSCIKLARLLQTKILEFLEKKIPCMEISNAMIDEAFPRLNDKSINSLIDYVAEAWDAMLSVCEVCPNACITRKDEYCTMFDDPYYYE